ncbi:MAG: DUF2490 domain-containing protein [Bacteroidetes bacterium]|nr:MAG: DUF2490 domain-containing protein [Bacteroidota bacterium]TAF92922.1 MAG: DUF2490 domain-containing protein [Bacteroidota bacterium]
MAKTTFSLAYKAIVLMAFVFCQQANAQQFTDLGTWQTINVRSDISNKWSFFVEAQLRSLSFYNNFHYYEYKGGINYQLHKNLGIMVGLGDYNTYSPGGNFKTPKQNAELRSWFQVTVKQPLNAVTLEHRYRAEQRFTSAGYRNRFRYRVQLTAPLARHNKYKPFWYVGNEIFVTDREPMFERNRLAAGIGAKLTGNHTVQVGFLNQIDYRVNDEIGRNFLQISWLINVDFRQLKQDYSTNTD